MNRWFDHYYNNTIENYIFKMLTKYCSNHLDDLCILDTTVDNHWIDFYLNTIQATLVTSINNKNTSSNLFMDETNYDFLNKPLNEHVGAFSNQYDVIHVLNSLSFEVNDSVWQKSLENLCLYIKSGGFMIISGNLQTSYTGINYRDRSEGLWRAIINNLNCNVKHFFKTPLNNFIDVPYDILIVGKK